MQQPQPIESAKFVSLVEDLAKLTGLATFVFILLSFIGVGISFAVITEEQDSFSFYTITLFFIFACPVIYLYFLPWMESFGINTRTRENKKIAVIAAILVFALCIVGYYAGIYIQKFIFEYVLYKFFWGSHTLTYIFDLMRACLTPLLWFVINYVCFLGGFSLAKKWCKITPTKHTPDQEPCRARYLSKWVFILSQSIYMATSIVLMLLFFYLWRDLDFNGGITALYLTIFIYLLALFVSTALIYAFTQNKFPKDIQQVQPKKLYYCLALGYIFAGVFCFAMSWSVEKLIRLMINDRELVMLILLFSFAAAIWACKHTLFQEIKIHWIRIMAAVLIIVPTLAFVIWGARDAITFLFILFTAFSVLAFTLFALSQFIKYVLSIVYRVPIITNDSP